MSPTEEPGTGRLGQAGPNLSQGGGMPPPSNKVSCWLVGLGFIVLLLLVIWLIVTFN